MTKIRATLFLTLLLVSALCSDLFSQNPAAVKGVFDLRQIQNKDKFIFNLNGEWEFYWKKMLHPHDFDGSTVQPKPNIYGKVPSYWTDYSGDNLKTEKYGYATYRLTVLLPANFSKSIGFSIPVFDSSYDLYINGELKSDNGQTGKSESETKPGYKPAFFRYIQTSDTISIIINVSNYHHRRGGFWLPMQIGTFPEVQKKNSNKWAGDYAAMSLLLGFALFFLIFFIYYPKERIMAFFSLALLGLALRPLFSTPYLIYDFVALSWQWTVKLEYFCLFFVMMGWAWFADSLYPSSLIRAIAYAITTVFLLATITTLLFPVKVFSYSVLAYYPSMIVLLVYVLFRSFSGILKKRVIDAAYFAAFVLFAIGAIHDILVSLGKSNSRIGYVMSFVVVIFIFIQAALLLYNWVRAYYEKARLHDELEFMNRNLEKLVSERTLELKTRNEEIEKQNSRIALQNKQLSDTIHLKNKIFSVIAHDLRSPVVNILYMLNLLKEEEYKEKYDTFANSSIQYAQLVINLLENMLVWGRDQEDKIKYSPDKHDLANIILTNLSIIKETADHKDISVNFTQIGSSVAYFDKDLMDIVVRNLLSNAVKFNNRGGRISILVKNRSNNGEGVLIKICDNGVGIPPERQKNLFTSDEIESTPGTENEKGTGLGLKLCQELVRINMGTISFESKEGEGTCFMIVLPEEIPASSGQEKISGNDN
jgi:signal transduction histidine kinase